MESRLLVLGWHNVEGTWCFPAAPGAGTQGLREQFRFLSKVANVVPLADAVRALAAGRRLPPRAVAITFDDGYRDNLDLAVPMLEELGLPATFFLVPGLLSGTAPDWWETLAWAFANATVSSLTWEGERLAAGPPGPSSFGAVAERLKRRNQIGREAALHELVEQLAPEGRSQSLFLDWDGARQIAQRGFTIGSHSLRHSILRGEEPAEQQRDLFASRQLLEAELGVPVELLAYPNGTARDYDKVTLDAVRQAGYIAAVTTRAGWNHSGTSLLELRRLVICPERGVAGLLRALGQTVKGRISWRAADRRGESESTQLIGEPEHHPL